MTTKGGVTECVCVCVRTHMCINNLGAGSAKSVKQTKGSVWRHHVVTLSLSGPQRRRPDR